MVSSSDQFSYLYSKFPFMKHSNDKLSNNKINIKLFSFYEFVASPLKGEVQGGERNRTF